MGRLIDADVLREEVYSWGMNDYEPSDFTDAIDDASTVEAIPKDQYEARLKADMIAMLEELKEQLREMHDDFFETEHFEEAYGVYNSMDVIQQKIDDLVGKDGNIREERQREG